MIRDSSSSSAVVAPATVQSPFQFKLLLLLVVLGLPVAGRAAPEIPMPVDAATARTDGESPRDGLDRSEWKGIRAAHEEWRHRFRKEEGGVFLARNSGQQWETTFDGRGFLTRPDHGAWEWGLELRGYGIGKRHVSMAEKSEGLAEEARLVYHRDKLLEEWFLNDKRGLEQGWTLSERPSGADDEKLIVDLSVRGGLRPEIVGSGRSVRFVDDMGAAALTYGGLKAWDSAGRVLETRFVPEETGLRIEVDERGAVYPVTIDPVAQQAYLKASNPDGDDEFGFSVAVDGDTVVVGAPFEGSNATGVDGDDSDNSALSSGAAYVFIRSGGTWSQQAYLKSSDTDEFDNFGQSVSVDGDTVVVGASGEASNATGVNGDDSNDSASASGAAYVFTRSGGTWSQQAYLKASNTGEGDEFGHSVAVSGDTAVVGAYAEDSNAIGVDGDDSDNNALSSGAAYVFVRSGGTWSQQAYLKASNTGANDTFGDSVAVDGDTVVVGAITENSDATGVDGDESDESAVNSGAAYVFARSGTTWSQQAYLKASNTDASDSFGRSVSVDGDTVVVGAYLEDSNATGVDGGESDDSAVNSGAAYVFTRSGTTWSQQAYLKASNTDASDLFGQSVSVDGDTVVVGARQEGSNATGVDGDENDNSAENSGAAYVFLRTGGVWIQQAYLKASNTDEFDYFGQSVSVDGDTVVVGAWFEDSNATGVNDNEDDNGTDNAGAAYVFQLPVEASPFLDITGPDISFLKKRKLKSPRPRHKIKGLVTDDVAVARVEVKSRLHRGWKQAKLKTNGQWIYRTPRLDPGRNAFKIRAVDSTGNLSRTQRIKATGR